MAYTRFGRIIEADKPTTSVTDNVTLDTTQIGDDILVEADAKVITLPATVVGYRYRIINWMADGQCLVTISPNASDKIMGGQFTTGTDDKDAYNTKATAKKGDFIELIADGVHGWFVHSITGTWASE